MNDIKDIDADREHPEKKNRPLAAGLVTMKEAMITTGILAITISVILLILGNITFAYIIAAMLAINVIYTNIGKKIPFVELFMIGVLYMLRTAAGFVLLGMHVPMFLLLTMLGLSLFQMSGQRLVELVHYGPKARAVLKRYTVGAIRRFLVAALMFAVISYSLAVAYLTGPIVYTNVVMLFILLYINEIYLNDRKIKDISDDFVRVFWSNKLLLVVVAIAVVVVLLYTLFVK